MDCSPPGSSVRGIFQTRILEWVANLSSRGSSWPKGQTWVSHLAGRFFTIWATRKALVLKTLPTFAWRFSLWFCCFTFLVVKSWLISTFPQALSLSSIRTRNTHFWYCSQLFDFPGGSDSKVSAYNAGDRFDPRVGKIPWRRKWQPPPVLLPGKSHGQSILVGYSPWGCKESDTTERHHFL